MSGYNPNRDSGIAEPRSFAEISKDSVDGMVEETDGVPQENQRYFAQLVYGINGSSNDIKGYNPNKDSGIADPRSYVEIGKDALQGLVEEYGFVPTATQRYFAKIVYNVGQGGGGGSSSEFTQPEIVALKALATEANTLIGIAKQAIKTIIIDLNVAPEESDITKENVIISVKYNTTTNEYEAVPVPDPETIDKDYNYAEYLINIPGYVCNIECYNWLIEDEEHTQESPTTPTMEKILPKITFDPTIGDFGTTTIFLDKHYEYDAILELPSDKRLLKISYTQIPVEKHN